MKQILLSTAFALIYSWAYSQNDGFTFNDNGDFFANGKKIGKVVRTTNANFMTGAIPEFTVYDVNNVPRFLFEKAEGKFIFLDDNKSFLPRIVDAYAKQVAKFFAADSILTPRGYNVAYRAMFIKKYRGYDFSEKKERDYSAPVNYIEKNIFQGEVLIGSYDYRLMDNSKDVHVAVSDVNNKKVAFITVTKDPGSVAYVNMTIHDANQKEVKTFSKEFDQYGLLYKKGIEWIVQNGYLGSKPVTVKSTTPVVAAPIPEVEVQTRFLEIKEPEQKKVTPFLTTLLVSVNQSLTKMAIASNEMHVKGGLNNQTYNQTVRSRIIDLSVGKIVESTDSAMINYKDEFTFIADCSSIIGKTLKLEEINIPFCLKSDITGRTICFGKPPVGIRYNGPISENSIMGFDYKKAASEIVVFQNNGNETTVKYKINIGAGAKITNDRKKIYGAYYYKAKLWEDYDNLNAAKFDEAEPSDKNSKEYKSYLKRKEQFEKDRDKRKGKILMDPEFQKSKPSYQGFRVFNAETGQMERDFKLPEIDQTSFFEMLSDGRFFVKQIVSENGKFIGKASVFNQEGSRILATMNDLDNNFMMLNGTVIAGKTNHVLSVSDAGLIKVYDINSGRMVAQVNDGGPGKKISISSALVYLPIKDGFVIIPYTNGLISLFSIKEMKVVAELFITIDDWAILARDGRFDGSLNALDKLEWREYAGDKISSRTAVASTFDGYFTPRLFNQILLGETSKTVPLSVNKQKSGSLPALAVVSIDNQPLSATSEISNYKTAKKIVPIDFKVNTFNEKVKEIRLYNNSKLLGVQKQNNTSVYKFNLKLNSVLGETNAVYAVATTDQGIESEKVKIIVNYTGSDSQPPKMYALVIGVNEYKNPKYKLNYAYVDAASINKQIAASKSELFKGVEVTTLFDGQANKANIIQAIKSMSIKMKEQDVFLFYFAGHGTMENIDGKDEFFIVPFDVTQLYGDGVQLSAKAISASELRVLSSELNAQKQIFILDACNSAGALDAAATRGVAEERAVAQLARSTGSYWLTASGSEQFATEFKQLGHGVFTYSLLEAIAGKNASLTSDGILTMRELSAFVEQRVPELSQQYKGKAQYPASFSIGNDFPLLIYKR